MIGSSPWSPCPAVTPPVKWCRAPLWIAAALVLSSFAAPASVAAPRQDAPNAEAPVDGAAGMGDRLYPKLGNGGYDVRAYDIAFDYRGNDRPLEAVTRVDARATAPLKRFDLDFSHGAVHSVQVNGRPAAFRSEDEELVVTPAEPIPRGAPLLVEVRHTSDPRVGQRPQGWVRTRDGLVMANQADAAHRVFPCNDHPADKADFTLRVTAPERLTVVANGREEGRTTNAGRTTWTYRSVHPMATELAQVSIGDSKVIERRGPHALPLRDVVTKSDADRLEPLLAKTPSQIAWMERHVGTFPLEAYGVLSADAAIGYELETQTLSLFERDGLLGPEEDAAPLLVHELAHQWFGDSVTPATWSDLWLNEGFATWYQWLYAAEKYGEQYGKWFGGGKATLTDFARDAYRVDQALRADGGPPAAPRAPAGDEKLSIFRGNVYSGGALLLYALRQEIGAPRFALLQRAWVARHRDGNASTAQFIELASEIAGRNLGGFLTPWLYGATTPPMPGHPDWTVSGRAAPDGTHRVGRPQTR